MARTTDFRSSVLLAAKLGNDSDATVAIVGQLAGAVYGLSGIPPKWLAHLAWRERIEVAAERLFNAGWPFESPSDPQQILLSRAEECPEHFRSCGLSGLTNA